MYSHCSDCKWGFFAVLLLSLLYDAGHRLAMLVLLQGSLLIGTMQGPVLSARCKPLHRLPCCTRCFRLLHSVFVESLEHDNRMTACSL